mgnify:CR=1 FL=1
MDDFNPLTDSDYNFIIILCFLVFILSIIGCLLFNYVIFYIISCALLVFIIILITDKLSNHKYR